MPLTFVFLFWSWYLRAERHLNPTSLCYLINIIRQSYGIFLNWDKPVSLVKREGTEKITFSFLVRFLLLLGLVFGGIFLLFTKLHQEAHTEEKVKIHVQIKNLASNMLVWFSMGTKKSRWFRHLTFYTSFYKWSNFSLLQIQALAEFLHWNIYILCL